MFACRQEISWEYEFCANSADTRDFPFNFVAGLSIKVKRVFNLIWSIDVWKLNNAERDAQKSSRAISKTLHNKFINEHGLVTFPHIHCHNYYFNKNK